MSNHTIDLPRTADCDMTNQQLNLSLEEISSSRHPRKGSSPRIILQGLVSLTDGPAPPPIEGDGYDEAGCTGTKDEDAREHVTRARQVSARSISDPKKPEDMEELCAGGKETTTRFAKSPNRLPLTTIFESVSPSASGGSSKAIPILGQRSPATGIRHPIAQQRRSDVQDTALLDIDDLALQEFRKIWQVPPFPGAQTTDSVTNLSSHLFQHLLDNLGLVVSRPTINSCIGGPEAELSDGISAESITGGEQRFNTTCSTLNGPALRLPPIESSPHPDATKSMGAESRPKFFTPKESLPRHSETLPKFPSEFATKELPPASGSSSDKRIERDGRRPETRVQCQSSDWQYAGASDGISLRSGRVDADDSTNNLIDQGCGQNSSLYSLELGPAPLFASTFLNPARFPLGGYPSSFNESINLQNATNPCERQLSTIRDPLESLSPGGEARTCCGNIYSKYPGEEISIYQRRASLIRFDDVASSTKGSILERPKDQPGLFSILPSQMSRHYCRVHATDSTTKTIISAALPILLQIAEREGISTRFEIDPPVSSDLAGRTHGEKASRILKALKAGGCRQDCDRMHVTHLKKCKDDSKDVSSSQRDQNAISKASIVVAPSPPRSYRNHQSRGQTAPSHRQQDQAADGIGKGSKCNIGDATNRVVHTLFLRCFSQRG